MITVVICMIAAVVCCSRKMGMHEDEFYSYYSSNRTYGLTAEGTVSRDMIMDELTVRSGEGFNFALVKEVQSWDVHPPLYYFILHFVCSLTPGIFSMWQGLIINLICLFISLLLMKRIGNLLLGGSGDSASVTPDTQQKKPGEVLIDLTILAWGISAATLTGVVFIRMYMLLTVWILAVTLLHLKKNENVSFWVILGAVTFCGFMTHYYFFIWLFFLAVAWNIREIAVTKSIRTTLCYGLTMIVSFGLCYIFYPVFPAQMFRGQRGAQATGNFLDPGNTWERITFFAKKINRIGFGGILWVLAGLTVIMYLLNAGGRRGLRRKEARRSANDPRGSVSFSDTGVLMCALIGYFPVVSKTALMLGDSSIRYVMPVLGILYLCLAAGISAGTCGIAETLTHDADRGVRYGVIAACVIMSVLAVFDLVSDLHGNVSFLYPEKREHMEILSRYPDADVVYAYPPGQSWVIWADMTELLMFDEIYCIPSDEPDTGYDRPAVVYVDPVTAGTYGTGHEYLYGNEYSEVFYSD